MERYSIIKKLGEGSFGCVWKARNVDDGELVAIKTMKRKYKSWEECVNLQEVKSLRKMNNVHIVKLKEVIKEYDVLYFVFEYMDGNMHQLLKGIGRRFSEEEIRNWCLQMLLGLAHMHQQGYFHRDLKPENLLVKGNVIKIGDLGSAREINSPPPYTEYITTRWYRAPEVLLQSGEYNSAVDMWAMGAIMAELFTLKPIFPGSSSFDQMYKICSVIGTPTETNWLEGLKRASAINYRFPHVLVFHFLSLYHLPVMMRLTLLRGFVHGTLAKGQQLWRPFDIRFSRVAVKFHHLLAIDILSIEQLLQL